MNVNERAMDLAKAGAEANGIQNVTIHESNTYDNVRAKDYSVISSNPPFVPGKKSCIAF